jgi:hypothetical protein
MEAYFLHEKKTVNEDQLRLRLNYVSTNSFTKIPFVYEMTLVNENTFRL